MAERADFAYLDELIASGAARSPVLEVGSRAWQGAEGNFKRACERHGLEWHGTDLEEGDGVDFRLDILNSAAVDAIDQTWPTVLLFNLLEHVYDPTLALRHALRLVAPGGACVVAGPAVWQLHDFPADYWRPMPAFFDEFARREGLSVELRRWLVHGRTWSTDLFRDGAQELLPSVARGGVLWGRRRWLWSRVAHRALRTTGRTTAFPYVSYGVVLRRPI